MSVDCSSGKVVVGGGFSLSGSTKLAGDSYAVDGDTWRADGWEVTSENANWTVTVYAICVDG